MKSRRERMTPQMQKKYYIVSLVDREEKISPTLVDIKYSLK
jgi:hypothetical protein